MPQLLIAIVALSLVAPLAAADDPPYPDASLIIDALTGCLKIPPQPNGCQIEGPPVGVVKECAGRLVECVSPD